MTNDRLVIIHIPKCGGRALNSTLKKAHLRKVQWVGHAAYRELNSTLGFRSQAITWVALTRNPVSWYRSRLTFLRQHLNDKSPRADYADPYNAFSALAGFGNFSLDDYILAVQDPRASLPRDKHFWEKAPQDFLDVIEWLERTGRGLYTLTILQHCARLPLTALNSPGLVDQALTEIGSKFSFIRNEELKEDSEKILGVEISELGQVGSSNQFLRSSDTAGYAALRVLSEIDGHAAAVTGGYEFP